ncbi:mitochondrial import protein Pam17 [Pholiota conissans]|uniref:Presequence translocated-associated motor subunit PAM17 n=1 Tax=Pholiota conissans TaxID=109636 RepID=A0A9P5ZBY5_9AGAR|nr:mitochondrial import protein Pam17 [Pholiota conissans]
MESCIARGLRISTRQSTLSPWKAPQVFSRVKSTIATSKVPPTPAKTTAETSADGISWPEYLRIKKSKRTWQTVVTVPCALVGLAAGGVYFGNLDTDPLKPIMGIDPFFFYGFCTVGCAGLGALIGPTIGASIWRYTHRRVLSHIDNKDHEFFRRIAKNRVDVSLQNPTQPVPDYYGEKIGSLHQYRQWLRDQSKYRRKALLPEE